MASTPVLPPDRHVPFKKGGWGAAILTTAVAVGAFLTAYYIHTQTYRHPRDVMMREVYERPGSTHEAAQGTPAAGTTGDAAHEQPGATTAAPSTAPDEKAAKAPAHP